MHQSFSPKNDNLLPDPAYPERENGNIRINGFPRCHGIFNSDPFWGVRITGYQRSDNRDKYPGKEA